MNARDTGNTRDEAERIRQARDAQRAQWSAVAPAWQRHRSRLAVAGSPLTRSLIAAAAVEPGHRVLDLACGLGDPAFALAETVGPQGFVLGLDISEAMVAGARAWAAGQGVHNVEFRVIASELALGVPPASFDRATCRCGLMFMPDPAAALAALAAALKPGGRVAVSTWGPPERCPFLALPFQVLRRHVELPGPEPGAPGPFALADPEALAAVFERAGLEEVRIATLSVPVLQADTPEDLWNLATELAGPLASVLASLGEEERRAVREDAVALVASLFPGKPVALGGEALVASGRKPG